MATLPQADPPRGSAWRPSLDGLPARSSTEVGPCPGTSSTTSHWIRPAPLPSLGRRGPPRGRLLRYPAAPLRRLPATPRPQRHRPPSRGPLRPSTSRISSTISPTTASSTSPSLASRRSCPSSSRADASWRLRSSRWPERSSRCCGSCGGPSSTQRSSRPSSFRSPSDGASSTT